MPKARYHDRTSPGRGPVPDLSTAARRSQCGSRKPGSGEWYDTTPLTCRLCGPDIRGYGIHSFALGLHSPSLAQFHGIVFNSCPFFIFPLCLQYSNDTPIHPSHTRSYSYESPAIRAEQREKGTEKKMPKTDHTAVERGEGRRKKRGKKGNTKNNHTNNRRRRKKNTTSTHELTKSRHYHFHLTTTPSTPAFPYPQASCLHSQSTRSCRTAQSTPTPIRQPSRPGPTPPAVPPRGSQRPRHTQSRAPG